MKTVQPSTKRLIRTRTTKRSTHSDAFREEERQFLIHPVDEELEELLFGRLTEHRQRKMKSHLRGCTACCEHLIIHAEFIELLRFAIEGHSVSDILDPPDQGKTTVPDRSGLHSDDIDNIRKRSGVC
jgi:hypothetical protein